MDRTAFEEMGSQEVAAGVWRWVAFHPEWKQEVASAAIESGGRLVLIDPLLPAGAEGEAALRRLEAGRGDGQPVDIVLTVFYHERSAGAIADALPGTTLWVVHEGVEKVESAVTNPFRPGDALPGGLAALATARIDEVVLWDASSRSLFVGDVLLGRGPEGIELCPENWLPDGIGTDDLVGSLMPLLDLPIARILPGHGEPLLRNARARLKNLLEPGS
jgi:glyoxylase-like metal-dependent hydrolase (beta-lactamase superfamily II)